jgi:predicted RNase H-like nuclease (RuvC/YqgF family)
VLEAQQPEAVLMTQENYEKLCLRVSDLERIYRQQQSEAELWKQNSLNLSGALENSRQEAAALKTDLSKLQDSMRQPLEASRSLTPLLENSAASSESLNKSLQKQMKETGRLERTVRIQRIGLFITGGLALGAAAAAAIVIIGF